MLTIICKPTCDNSVWKLDRTPLMLLSSAWKSIFEVAASDLPDPYPLNSWPLLCSCVLSRELLCCICVWHVCRRAVAQDQSLAYLFETDPNVLAYMVPSLLAVYADGGLSAAPTLLPTSTVISYQT